MSTEEMDVHQEAAEAGGEEEEIEKGPDFEPPQVSVKNGGEVIDGDVQACMRIGWGLSLLLEIALINAAAAAADDDDDDDDNDDDESQFQ